MISGFYYLASYTAAVAAGFSEQDSAAIARAARYTEDCAGITAPAGGGKPESPLDQLLELAVFHYLPGNADEILRDVNPAFYEGLGAASAPLLALVCRPDGRLYKAAAEYARRGMTSGELSGEAALQRIGIVCHILAAAHLHQGFIGLACPAVNGACGVMTASLPERPQNMRELLLRTRTEPLETLFPMEPVKPDPAAGATGCEQVQALADCPSGIYSYQSAWAAPPLVSCVNPLRYAEAYFSLKAVLVSLREYAAGLRPTVSQAEEKDLLDAAVFFSGIKGNEQLCGLWLSFFKWLQFLPPYAPPSEETDALYLTSFHYQALQTREWLWRESPVLSACDTLFPAEDPAPAPEPTPEEGGAEPAPEEGGAEPAPEEDGAEPAPEEDGAEPAPEEDGAEPAEHSASDGSDDH